MRFVPEAVVCQGTTKRIPEQIQTRANVNQKPSSNKGVHTVICCANVPVLMLICRLFPTLPLPKKWIYLAVFGLRIVAGCCALLRHYQCKFALVVHVACTKRPRWCGWNSPAVAWGLHREMKWTRGGECLTRSAIHLFVLAAMIRDLVPLRLAQDFTFTKV